MHLETRYARSDDLHIAYQVVGDGPQDLVLVHGWVSHVEHTWTDPGLAAFQRRLASSHRLILFDKRGTGLSDRIAEIPTMEQRMDDVRAVMDAAGSERAVIMGVSEGGALCALFAATYPARTRALILYGAYAKRIRSPDYPWAPTAEERQQLYEAIEREWGGTVDLSTLAPSMARDARFCEWFSSYLRQSASPGAALALARMNAQIDIRHVLPAIRVPALVVHRTGDRDMLVGGARYLAQLIPGARFVELRGEDHLPWVGDVDAILRTVERFLGEIGAREEPERVLATVLHCTVDLPAALWDERVERVRATFRAAVTRFRGRPAVTRGRELVASFDGPARAISCAVSVRDQLRREGLAIGAGLHIGDCAIGEERLDGPARDVATRAASIAQPNRVLVSAMVKDLVAGSGIAFRDHGSYSIRGLPDGAHLYEVERCGHAEGAEMAGSMTNGSPPPPYAAESSARRVLHQQRVTDRQLEILRLVASGLSNHEIAGRLGLSEHTVHRHVANIFARLAVSSRAAAAAQAVREGLI